jgi:hypothetical protein
VARTFSNTGVYLSSGNAPVAGYPLSVAIWFQTAASGYIGYQLASLGDTVSSDAVYLATAGSPFPVSWRQQNVGGTNVVDTTAAYGSQVWQHACGVSASDSDHRVYVNGGNKGTSSVQKILNGFNQTSIATNLAHGFDFSGELAEFAVWNAALTDAEVATLAAGFSPLFVRPQNLQIYVPITGVHSPELDVRGRAPMTVTGTPPAASHPRIIRPTRGFMRSVATTRLGLCWGYATPDSPEEPLSWITCQLDDGSSVVVSGDANWGAVEIAEGEPVVTPVEDTGSTASKLIEAGLNKYTGSTGNSVLSIRGQATPFLMHDASPSWETYSEPVSKTWRYIQAKIEYAA